MGQFAGVGEAFVGLRNVIRGIPVGLIHRSAFQVRIGALHSLSRRESEALLQSDDGNKFVIS